VESLSLAALRLSVLPEFGELGTAEFAAGSRANRQARRLPYVGQASSLPLEFGHFRLDALGHPIGMAII
jgi:hypothetical protein